MSAPRRASPAMSSIKWSRQAPAGVPARSQASATASAAREAGIVPRRRGSRSAGRPSI